MSGKALKVSHDMAMNVVQGHHHSDFYIQYWSNPDNLFWAMSVGCMIDDKELAFEYGRLQKKRPLIGCGMIIDSQPKLIPLVKNKKGRWIKKLV
jgi:G:T/U-mismatch repair DNA glycosylase